MLLLIDNYDSFTYNLLHYLGELGAKVEVVRNDVLSVDEVLEMKGLEGIVISPGPCTPNESGICLDLIKRVKGKKPLLGVCLGHEAIGQAFGGKVIKAKEPMHGKVSEVVHDGKGIFHNIPSPFKATRYHSLIVDDKTLPSCLKVGAKTKDGVIMAMRHMNFPIFGVQFHPESIASEYGHALLGNFLKVVSSGKVS